MSGKVVALRAIRGGILMWVAYGLTILILERRGWEALSVYVLLCGAGTSVMFAFIAEHLGRQRKLTAHAAAKSSYENESKYRPREIGVGPAPPTPEERRQQLTCRHHGDKMEEWGSRDLLCLDCGQWLREKRLLTGKTAWVPTVHDDGLCHHPKAEFVYLSDGILVAWVCPDCLGSGRYPWPRRADK